VGDIFLEEIFMDVKEPKTFEEQFNWKDILKEPRLGLQNKKAPLSGSNLSNRPK
jgi:hypothetical protein